MASEKNHGDNGKRGSSSETLFRLGLIGKKIGMTQIFVEGERVPVTVLYVIPPNMPFTAEQYDGFMRASYANLPNARIVKIEDSWHFIMIDQFDRFMGEVNTFLAG